MVTSEHTREDENCNFSCEMLVYFPGKMQCTNGELCSTVMQPPGSDLFCSDGNYDDNNDGDYD